jgi:hypothetical protein
MDKTRKPKMTLERMDALKEGSRRDRCWAWPGALDKDGFPLLAGSMAVRVAYARYVGPVGPEMMVRRTCEDRTCINPAHLFLEIRDKGGPKPREPKPPRAVRIVDGVAYIALPCGLEAIVDETDLSLVNDLTWHSHKKDRNVYAVHEGSPAERASGGPNRIPMQRLLFPAPEGLFVDHVDGNGLNNRRNNLRHCTHAENMRNRRPMKKTGLPKGVYREGCRFRAAITINRVTIQLGTFDTLIEAASAYDAGAAQHHGEFASPNNLPKPKVDILDLLDEAPQEPPRLPIGQKKIQRYRAANSVQIYERTVTLVGYDGDKEIWQ